MAAAAHKDEPGLVGKMFRGIAHWLLPCHRCIEGGQTVVIYTTFPKAFYLYVLWLPGSILLVLHRFNIISDSAGVWTMMVAGALAYLVIAEDITVKGAILLITWALAIIALYFTHWLDWSGLPILVRKIKDLKVAIDQESLKVFTVALFVVWAMVYLFSVTWRKRELSSLRRSKLRPPLGRKPLPITGLVVDLHPRDVLEMIFGFGSHDVILETRDGKIIDRDTNCVGLGFVAPDLNRLISELTVKEESGDPLNT